MSEFFLTSFLFSCVQNDKYFLDKPTCSKTDVPSLQQQKTLRKTSRSGRKYVKDGFQPFTQVNIASRITLRREKKLYRPLHKNESQSKIQTKQLTTTKTTTTGELSSCPQL